MVENLKQWISEVTRLDRLFAGDEVDLNTQMAIAMLLAMAANSDGSIDNAELQAMVAALTRRYQLSSIVALDLLTRAIEDLSSGHADPNLFAELRKKLNTAQKEDCLVMILDVIAADGEKEAREMAMLADAISGLGISDKSLDAVFARYFAEREPRT